MPVTNQITLGYPNIYIQSLSHYDPSHCQPAAQASSDPSIEDMETLQAWFVHGHVNCEFGIWDGMIHVENALEPVSISTWKIKELAWTLDSIQATESQLQEAVATNGGTPSDLGCPLTPDSSATLSRAFGNVEIATPVDSEAVPDSPIMQPVPQKEPQDGKDTKELTSFAFLGCCHKMIEFIQGVTLHILTISLCIYQFMSTE